MDRLRQLEVFVRTAELGSLSRAAQSLGMSNAAVSRHLAMLEERVAVRLIERNTRRLWLTETGQEFLSRCGTLLGELAEAEDALTEQASSPRGLLRVTSSLSFAMIYIAPILPRFRALYPDLDVQVTAANRYPDFIEAGIDVAIRTREQEPDSTIVVRRLGRVKRLLAAAPDYLARRGIPCSPAELAEHDMLVYNLAHDPYSLRLKRGEHVEDGAHAGRARQQRRADHPPGRPRRGRDPHPAALHHPRRHRGRPARACADELDPADPDDERRLPEPRARPDEDPRLHRIPHAGGPRKLAQEHLVVVTRPRIEVVSVPTS